MNATSTRPPSSPKPSGLRKLLLVIVACLVVAGVAGGGYGLWYILLGPSSPAAVSSIPPALPTGAGVTLQPASGAESASLDGTWDVNTSLGALADGTATFAGYRVQEQLVGVGGHTAVGRTTKVTGSMSLAGTVVSNVQITVDMTALASDDSHRDDQLTHQAIETGTFPTSTFKTTAPIDLGAMPADGATVTLNATGELTLHGVTESVTIPLQATRKDGVIAVAGSIPILFSDYNIQKPNSFSLLSVDDHGTMELHLLFTHA
ncbi:MAG TPA: YceI family protein [Candidatus Limnocylindrales bacterium]